MSELEEHAFRLVLEYDGAGFEGWQVQAGSRVARTVQGVLAEAWASVTGEVGRVRGAGRTDAGVHAWGQVASIRGRTGLAPERLAAALNARLPDDVAVVSMTRVPLGWDALRAARSKHYRYQIWNGGVRSPLREGRWCWVREPLSVESMRTAAEAFVGRHDFSSMRAAGSSAKTSTRRLTRFEISGRAGGEIGLEVEGEGFLRHMVRNLAGTLIEIGRGRWAPGRAAEILAARDRAKAGPTAPAEGLVLVSVADDQSAGQSVAGELPSRSRSVDEGGPVG